MELLCCELKRKESIRDVIISIFSKTVTDIRKWMTTAVKIVQTNVNRNFNSLFHFDIAKNIILDL